MQYKTFKLCISFVYIIHDDGQDAPECARQRRSLTRAAAHLACCKATEENISNICEQRRGKKCNMKQLLFKCSVRSLPSWASLEPQCDVPVSDELRDPERPPGLGGTGHGGPGQCSGPSGRTMPAELHLPSTATDRLKKLCQGGKQPVGELGKQTRHCLPF